MTPAEICLALVRHEISRKVAIERLITEAGYDLAIAEETIFIALGGDDIITTGTDGTDRYHLSGKIVT